MVFNASPFSSRPLACVYMCFPLDSNLPELLHHILQLTQKHILAHAGPVWTLSASSLDLLCIQSGSCLDLLCIMSGSCVDPLCIKSGSCLDLLRA